jgi:hypothetical protein
VQCQLHDLVPVSRVRLDMRVLRWLAAAGVVSAFMWLALQHSARTAELSMETEISAVPATPRRCRAHGDQARAQASLLEQLAAASWERVPFEPAESPRAVAQIAEAEVCFAAAHDRAGRLRSAALYYRYSADLERRFARARLLLRIAVRAEERRARDPRSGVQLAPSDAVARQVAMLLALLERAPPSALGYRVELERLARRQRVEQPATLTRMESPVNRDRTQLARTP